MGTWYYVITVRDTIKTQTGLRPLNQQKEKRYEIHNPRPPFQFHLLCKEQGSSPSHA